MSNTLTVLVTGATGKQGNAVARSLLRRGHRVRGMTRRLDGPEAKELRRLGAEVVFGTFDDRISMERAARETSVVFAMTTPYEAGTGVEVSQGFGLINACRNAGVQHIVYGSVAGADKATGIPHFDSKARIERHLSTVGIGYTIVAPVFFMENFLTPWFLPSLREGKLAMGLPADRKLQMIAVRDIGEFVAEVIVAPERFHNRRVEIASDDPTGLDASQTISRISGHEVQYTEIPIAEVRSGNADWGRMFDWFRETGYSANISALRTEYPDIGWHTFDQWAAEQDWAVLRPIPER